MAERGRFITFEGGEGAGKSTQARRLATALRAQGLEVLETREPGGSPGAEEIRRLLTTGEAGRWSPMAETLLHNAARADHLRRTVRPALTAGSWVVSDRFADSTMAYQGYGQGLDRGFIAALSAAVVDGLEPALTLIFDLPVAQGLARAAARSGAEDRYERMDLSFHEALRQGFLAIAAAAPQRCVVVDAAGDEVATWVQVKQAVRARLGLEVA
ncbi:MAG TPA: dTMP kinase [Verrucomicrobiae bacterium]|nr:dTMP kinase [Verrucomicrobiae bacterium]